MARLFVRKRDGRIDVRMNDDGRAVVRHWFAQVVAAEQGEDHEWRPALSAPINPANDVDDPLLQLSRQSEISSRAELALATAHESSLTDGEAWAWLTTLQVALRSIAQTHGLLSDERLQAAPAEQLDDIHTLQYLLFELAECL